MHALLLLPWWIRWLSDTWGAHQVDRNGLFGAEGQRQSAAQLYECFFTTYCTGLFVLASVVSNVFVVMD